jgi:ketosteroid isomerase-like protein
VAVTVRSTQEVLDHHLKAFGDGNLDAIMSDYVSSSVLFKPDGLLKGLDAIRGLFKGMFAEFAKPGTSFAMHQTLVDGDYAYIVWSAETADNKYEASTDTFVIRDGKIVAQTFCGKVTRKA